MPYLLFLKKRQNLKLLSMANYESNLGGALWVKFKSPLALSLLVATFIVC